MSLPRLGNRDRVALFCDFDGTLVDIAPAPDLVAITAATRRSVERLAAALDGAFAIVTGRDIEVVDRFLAPLRLPTAGVHGLVRRDAAGTVHAVPIGNGLLDAITGKIDGFAATRPGLFVEHKPGTVVLHYRGAPELEADCIALAESAVDEHAGLVLRRGKKIVEVGPGNADKGAAIEAFMREPPFAGRSPVFAGDDLTDEDGFAVVNRMGGKSIKIGPEPSCATYRAGGTQQFLAWLGRTAGRLSAGVRE